jgi:hypothetical protein
MTEDMIIEQVARGIAEAHFAGKQHPSWWGPDEVEISVGFQVDRYWKTYVPHACKALVAVRDVLKSVGRQQDSTRNPD